MSKRTIWITGASSGIGQALVKTLDPNKFRFVVSARRKARLEDLKNSLPKHDLEIIELDIRDKKAVFEAVENYGKKVDVLVNNAGLAAGYDDFQDADLADWEQMIDTNVTGLLYMSKAILPWMPKKENAHIINIDSTAGKEVYPKGNVYCATKHAVDAISKGMRLDLVKEGIKVTNICPGMVNTEFSKVRFHGDQEKADQVYQGFKELQAEDIAQCIDFALNLPAHICINDLVVTATAQANSYITHRE
ncbi:MAG: SDR family NAD(P)-dependent oxidoreductase [Flavobacteriales bacterium]|jgi:NADP-dependent 3-hydroxy acid dehydrogenase YdfG|nr:SDR family NAD(P)-dependent oxidoreductase [Flavobacteriales bacterium]